MVLCEQCKKRPASIEIVQIINNSKTVVHLCSECAKEKQGMMIDFPMGNINDFLGELLNSMGGFAPTPTATQTLNFSPTCKTCNMSYDDFVHTGMLGCPDCYESFNNRLNPIFQRLHGSKTHTGKVPKGMAEKISSDEKIGKLKDELQKAISEEEYEKAAQIRDEIRELENGKKNNKEDKKDE